MQILLIALILLAAFWLIAWLAGSRLPETHRATRAAVFHQSPEALWEAIVAPEKLPGWRSGIPLTRVEEIPHQKLVMRIAGKDMPFGGTWVYEIAPESRGTRLRITENSEIYNTIFRAMTHYFFGYTRSMESFLQAVGRKFGESPILED